jgi:hypothetical protein
VLPPQVAVGHGSPLCVGCEQGCERPGITLAERSGCRLEPVDHGPSMAGRSGALAAARRPRTVLARVVEGRYACIRTATLYFVTDVRCPGVSAAGIAFRVSSPCR